MITVRKLRTLKESTRFRKYILIIQELENSLKNRTSINNIYYREILKEIGLEKSLSDRTRQLALGDLDVRTVNSLRHSIMSFLKLEPSEWDFTNPVDRLAKSEDKLGINIYLDDIRSPFNLGSLFRTAECFSVNKISLSIDTTDPGHNRAKRTAMGCIDLVKWERCEIEKIKGPVFALELGGIPIDEFKFPTNGTVIIGSEELGVSPVGLKIADNSSGRVAIPMSGGKSSLNVANATAILLQRWHETLLKG